MDNLNKELHEAQAKTIGLFKHPAFRDSMELVVEECEHTFKTITIGSLFGLNTTTLSKSEFTFTRFPDGKTLRDMLDDPIEFTKWYKSEFPKY